MLPQSLNDFHGESRPSGSQVCFRTCPVCGSDKYKTYVNMETGAWYCFAGGHGGGGHVEVGHAADTNVEGKTILRMLDRDRDEMEWGEADLPPFHALSDRALRYMERRGFSEEVCRRYGIVEWENKFRILLPYFDRGGQLIYWNSRRYSDNLGDGPKYVAAPGRHPLYIPARRPQAVMAVVVEGVLDALAVVEADPGVRAIALGGKSLPKYLRRPLTEATKNVILIVGLDPDALAEALRLQGRIGGRILDLPDDPAAMWADDPDELRRRLA
jgi:hypothetical protein